MMAQQCPGTAARSAETPQRKQNVWRRIATGETGGQIAVEESHSIYCKPVELYNHWSQTTQAYWTEMEETNDFFTPWS
ncbi:Hypothetical predicted protein [Olea europaea subsp. europaea]|uniref:Uncharacterized protein n=1 Tax=Olea europaea subsp. europaea TaxID=158383 RepID=A0A8S0V778_OLEEU|nr:Hypothetical predicted protein [Olea europaea subsp. europaea]CAA3027269.1 Hypothetical predicted protein [Olea europaea subsp. europaea]